MDNKDIVYCCFCKEPIPPEWYKNTGYEWCYFCDLTNF